MKLIKGNLSQISTIAHDGKVLLFGTDEDGIVWYTVKQSGFEDTVFTADPDIANGFEDWRRLPLGESTYDASILKKFNTLLVPVFGKDQAGKENSQSVKSAVAPVQLVSGMGHLHVFRQSTDNKLLVNRFILDGMRNELMPKLDVRFKRSRQKYEVSENMKIEKDAEGNAAVNNVDAPDFKDMEGNPFYEPTWKLDFIENLHKGWFSPVLVPTLENGKYRWNVFVYDSIVEKVILYTVRASHSQIFDLKDYAFVQLNPKTKKSLMRTIHGIIKRTLDIKTSNMALVASNGLAATIYNLQKERVGDDGQPQLLKDDTRVMLAVPVKEEGAAADAKPKAAALSFAVCSDGTLSQVDESPETHQLFANVNELILPLNTLQEVKELIYTTPPPSGVMAGVEKNSAGTVTVLSRNLPETLKSGENVKISGTKNYNGLYEVVSVIEEEDGTKSFEIATTFKNDEAGFWEVVPRTQAGLTFDNMVVSYQKANGNHLKVTCSSHNLGIGDEVQVTGTRQYDGLYPIKAVDEINGNFTIDMDYQPGEAVDLKAKKRRGIRFGGGADYLRTGSLKLDPFVIDTNSGRTVSAWVWLESTTNQAQLIVGQEDQAMELGVDIDNKLQLKVHLDDNTFHTVTDPDDLPLKTWVHYAGTVEYHTSNTSNATHLYLCKNGVMVVPTAATGETVVEKEKVVVDRHPTTPATAFQLGGTKPKTLPVGTPIEAGYSDDYRQNVAFSSLLPFDRADDYIDLGENVRLGSRFTQECWVYPSIDDDGYHLLMGNNANVGGRSPSVYIVDQTKIHAGYSSRRSIELNEDLNPGGWESWAQLSFYDSNYDWPNTGPYSRYGRYDQPPYGRYNQPPYYRYGRYGRYNQPPYYRYGRYGRYGQPPYGQPPYSQPSSEQPSFEQTSFEQPPSEQPPFEQPPFEQPPSEQPPFEQPPSEQPPFEQPPSEQPPFEQPPFEQPPSEQPPFEQPPFEQPPSEQPPFEQPVDQLEMPGDYSSGQSTWVHFTSDSVLTKNAWNHIALTYDETYYKLYVNGVEKHSMDVSATYRNTVALTPQNNSVKYLSAPEVDFNFKGYLQEVRLWNKALPATQINANKERRLTGQQNGLLAYYKFDMIDGSTLPDQSGNGRNGTISHSRVARNFRASLTLKQRQYQEATVTNQETTIMVPKKNAVTIQRTAPAAALTLAFWIKTYASSDVDLVNYTAQYTQSGDIFTISTREFSVTRPGYLRIYVGNSSVDTNVTVSDGEWHHLAVSWESENGVLVLHKDGDKAFMQSDFQKGYKLSQATTAALVLGANGNDYLEGSLGEVSVWSKVLSTGEVKRLTERLLTGDENHLVGAWVHGGNQALDLSRQRKHGSLYDNPSAENISKLSSKTRPVRLLVGGAGKNAGSFAGKLSELRVWNIAKDEKTVKDGMHMPLSGREDKLAGNWRMGAIVIEKGVKQVPDFSTQSNNALVYGTPFVSERSLSRKNADDKKIVKYANDELVAVSQRARYRESFEFKIEGADGNAWTLDKLNNADDRGNKVFQFAYWGKASRSSEKKISFSPDLYSQDEFSAVAGAVGWFRASCEFIVPDGVAMVRSFEIGHVKGLWIGMEVRKHEIEVISDAITRKAYTDDISLATTGGVASSTLYDLWEEIRGLEFCEADLSRHLQDLMLRIDVVTHKEKYSEEKGKIEAKKTNLTSELISVLLRREWLTTEIPAIGNRINRRSEAFDNEISDYLNSYYRWITVRNAFRNHFFAFLFQAKIHLAQTVADAFDAKVKEARRKKELEIGPLTTKKYNFEEEQKGITERLPQLEAQLKILNDRRKVLVKLLAPPLENREDLDGWKSTTQQGLERVRALLNTRNVAFLRTFAQNQQQPQSMEQVDIDSNKLVTQGALLTFISPKSRLQALESARGNVELNYFDTLNRLQCTAYDATADTRNTTFQQWLPSSLRPAVEFRENADKMYFKGGKAVPMTNRWTLETLFQYPLVAQASGEAYETQVLAEDVQGRHIVIKAGRYLGAQVEGAFFETGIDLDNAVAPGWHHLAVTVEKDNGLGFYLDGKKHGATPKKHTMAFPGNNIVDYVKWSSFKNFPTTSFTVSFWVKTLGRNDCPALLSYGTPGNLDALMLYDVNPVIVRLGDFSLTTGVSLDDGFWHHLAITWKSTTGVLKVYQNGHAINNRANIKQGYTIPGNGTLMLGQGLDSPGGKFKLSRAFDGVLRGLSIWNAVRNWDDIRRDMYTTFIGNETNLVGYWPMETFMDGGILKVKDLNTTSPQHGEIAGTPSAEIVSVINESGYQIKTIGNAANGGKPFGRLAEMRMWCQSLTADEIATHARVNVFTGDEPGLVAYYPMNEAIGTTVRDHAAGTKIHAVLAGADWKACTGEMNKPASENPKFKALSFDGRADFVEIPGLRGQLDGDEITIEYWFKGSKIQSAVRQEANGSFLVATRGGGTQPKHALSNDGGTANALSAGDVQNGQWHHVAMTWKKGATAGFVSYVDGEMVGQRDAGSTAIPAINGSLYLGCLAASEQPTQDQQFTKGQLAEVRIWKKARTKEQIIANMHRRLTGEEAGLKACYPLDTFMQVDGVIKVRDVTPNNNHGTVSGATLASADIFITDHVERPEALYFDGIEDCVDCGTIDIANKSFSFECWVKNSRPGTSNFFAIQGTNINNKGLHIGFRDTNHLSFDFCGNRVESASTHSDQDWHHFGCTYDHTSRTQTLYRDGAKVGQRRASAHYSGTGILYLGASATFQPATTAFKGFLDDVRLWSRVLSEEEIRIRKNQRLSGKEPSLIGYWPVEDLVEGKLKDRSAASKYDGTINGAKLVEASTGLPFTTVVTDFATASISACEYATMGIDAERPGLRTAMLRSFRAYSTKPGDVEVLSDQRIESLELKWVGNAQFEPTLLGFIEGAPPVPSENLTVDYDYNNASSVTLRESQDVSYTWNRTRDTSQGLDLDLFVGAGWGVSGGIGIESTISEGQAGFKGSLNTRFVDSNSSNITSGTTLSFNDTLALRGEQERGTKFPHLGKRFVPKNVGYALVVSGLADIYITRLARSRRMISYEMRPVEGVPLDVNTITFHINPTYVMNGSLDGLSGSQATSERFFRHVPEMRAQYGSLYPASYYRIKEAYDLKEQIEQWDKDREAYFWNFDVTWRPGVDPGRQMADPSQSSSFGQVSVKREEDEGKTGDDENSAAQKQKQKEKLDKLEGDMEKEEKKAKAKARKRKDEINKRFGDPETRARASSALDGWQSKMENLLLRAGKRNIVNNYVWDANGGLHAESQDFANTIEHTIGSNFTIGGTLGGLVDAQISAFKLELTALYAGELTQTSSKTENIGKTFGLDVDLYGVESNEVTNLDGKPLKPGEKVARYRFMSFYLGGNTDNFHDFFDYVVDPEWLAGNSEGARALRQTKAAKPNKAWRVLHRVTYVERPSLEGVGVDTRRVSNQDQVAERTVNYFDSLEKKNRAIQADLATVLKKLGALQNTLGALQNQNVAGSGSK